MLFCQLTVPRSGAMAEYGTPIQSSPDVSFGMSDLESLPDDSPAPKSLASVDGLSAAERFRARYNKDGIGGTGAASSPPAPCSPSALMPSAASWPAHARCLATWRPTT